MRHLLIPGTLHIQDIYIEYTTAALKQAGGHTTVTTFYPRLEDWRTGDISIDRVMKMITHDDVINLAAEADKRRESTHSRTVIYDFYACTDKFVECSEKLIAAALLTGFSRPNAAILAREGSWLHDCLDLVAQTASRPPPLFTEAWQVAKHFAPSKQAVAA